MQFLFDGIIGEVISERYELEYGSDCLEMCVGAVQPGERVVIMDDLVATGGTLSAAILLVGKLAKHVNSVCLSCLWLSCTKKINK